MKSITIKRQKSFVGCLSKMYVYIKSEEGNVNIAGEKYKLAGKIKNNDVLHFTIRDDEDVIRINYYGSKSFYPVSYRLRPESTKLYLHISPKFNPFEGNPIKVISALEE